MRKLKRKSLEIRDCEKCRDWKGCIGKEWYSPPEIGFCRYQMLWFIKHWAVKDSDGEWEITSDGLWPDSPDGSSYTDIALGHKAGKHGAYFETPAQIAAEIDWRIKRTKLSGKLLVADVVAGMDYKQLSREAKNALNYISGWNRKKPSFSSWLKNRRYKSDQKVAKTLDLTKN